MKKYRVRLIGGVGLSIKKMDRIIEDFKKLGEARCNGNDFFLLPSSGINSLKWAEEIKKRADVITKVNKKVKVKAIIEMFYPEILKRPERKEK